MMKTSKVLSVNTLKSGQRQAAKLEERELQSHPIIGKQL